MPAAPKKLTFDHLISQKKPRKRNVSVSLSDDSDETVDIVLQSIGRKRYEALMTEHPATKEQNAEAKKETGEEAPYNVETFPIALISACALEPIMTEEQVQQVWDEWNSAEVMELFFAALEVTTARRHGLGKESGVTSDSEKS